MNAMNYNHLFYFWTVARHGSIRGASQELGLAQPTVSEQLRKLEEELDASLLERAGRGLRLSGQGTLLFSYADRIFRLGGEMREALAGRAAQQLSLSVGIEPSLSAAVAHRLLTPALRAHKGLRLHCVEEASPRLYARLALRQLDVILSSAPLPPAATVRAHSHLLHRCGVSFLAATSKPGRTPASRLPQRLDGAPFLMQEAGTALHNRLAQWFQQKNIQPRIAGEFSNATLLELFARQGLGAIAVPTLAEREVCANSKLTVLGRTKELTVEFYAITCARRVAHPAAAAIVAAAKPDQAHGRRAE
jgi:LysR family transcriptional activator of nhaA